MAARLFVILQYLLPRYWLTALVYRIARVRRPAVKDWLITRFVRLFDIDVFGRTTHSICGFTARQRARSRRATSRSMISLSANCAKAPGPSTPRRIR